MRQSPTPRLCHLVAPSTRSCLIGGIKVRSSTRPWRGLRQQKKDTRYRGPPPSSEIRGDRSGTSARMPLHSRMDAVFAEMLVFAKFNSDDTSHLVYEILRPDRRRHVPRRHMNPPVPTIEDEEDAPLRSKVEGRRTKVEERRSHRSVQAKRREEERRFMT